MATFRINGQQREVEVDGDVTLLSLLRDYLGLTGSKYGCGEGKCGACTVLVDGKARRSCVVDAPEVAGKEIVTIEGLAPEGGLHPIQQAFIQEEAFQCGYCTTGMIMAATAFLKEKPNPTEEEIIQGMNGSICRCGTYPRIVAAVAAAAGAMKGLAR